MEAIQTFELTKHYGKNIGIENVSFSVQEGEMFGFIGPNGAGKSTTIKTLLNFLFPTSGRAEILGFDSVLQAYEIKKIVSYVPSEVRFYNNMTSRELLKRTLQFYGIKQRNYMRELVQLFEIDDYKRFMDLSQGNKKKVAIVSALLSQPKLLVLDEPSSGLDPVMQKRFFELIKQKVAEGMTVFLSSHVLKEVQTYCSRAAFIKDGHILTIQDIKKEDQNSKTVILEGPFQRPILEGAGLVWLKEEGEKQYFRSEIDMVLLSRALYESQAAQYTVENPSLEDEFFHLYEGGNKA